ncbi:alpha/beta hydrolase [Mucilaginibacter mali]|uniref:Alpha/beta hydrolase n=1 Tax=Mucilaginibacter mali TaxID=2740462 RepID=A0A7D4UN74_9SPHI|nr:alpha/beta hydrolase-fold protein [Mucilaginibacter mali]QKJ31721.1 alpha/beta hydrolase [Mucilaginibacter mali]
MKQTLLLIIACALFIQTAQAQTTPKETDQPHYITTNLSISQLQRQRDIQIYLPADYYKTGKKYPVIYMQDAQNIYNKDGSRKNSWCVDSVLKTLPDSKQCIIVGINHGAQLRIAEYSPYKSNYGAADGPAYTEFMVNTLKPYIDAHYRTKTDAANTAIAGSSMGGLIALYATIKYPKVFGTAGIFSPALWINPQINHFVDSTGVSAKSRFYQFCGDQEGNEAHDVAQMDTLLMKKGVKRAHMPPPVVLKGEKHNEHQWMLEFPDFYKWWVAKL